jgi:ribosomal protein L37E
MPTGFQGNEHLSISIVCKACGEYAFNLQGQDQK